MESTFVNLVDNSVDYYEVDTIPSHCIEARSSEEALRIFAEKCKTYRKTAERFQVDDFDVIIYGNKWYIESNVYRIRIPRSVFNHIDMLLRKDGCTYLYN